MDIAKEPKQFLENVTGGFSQESFALAMLSGEHAVVYALTPQHTKRLSQWLAYQIEHYEKTHGPIAAQWEPGMKSPIQSTDLSIDKKDNGRGKTSGR